MNQSETQPQLISVTIELRQRCFVGTNNWKCHINGIERIVTHQKVQYYCLSLKEAIQSFREEEIERFAICGTVVQNIFGN